MNETLSPTIQIAKKAFYDSCFDFVCERGHFWEREKTDIFADEAGRVRDRNRLRVEVKALSKVHVQA